MSTNKYRENRSARPDTVRTLALDPLDLEGVPVVHIEAGEYIRCEVFREAGTLFAGPIDATYDTFWTSENGTPKQGWHIHFRTPDALPVGKTSEKLKIKWSYRIGVGDDVLFDELQMTAEG